MNNLIEKYIDVKELHKMPIKQVELFKSICTIYHGINGNDLMLTSAIAIYKRLYPFIKNLSKDKQLNILHEATMAAYDARIAAFDHMLNYNPKI